MMAFAVPALFTGISFYWLKLSDRFFLLHYQGKAEVGLYTVANALAQPLFLVLMAFRMAWPQWHYAKLDDPDRAPSPRGPQLDLLPQPERPRPGAARRHPAAPHPRPAEPQVLERRAGDLRPRRVHHAVRRVLHLLGGGQRGQEESDDPRLLRHRLGGQRRPQLRLRPALRHVGGGLDDGGRLRDPRRHHLLLLAALLPHPLRVATPPQAARRDRALARRRGRRHASDGSQDLDAPGRTRLAHRRRPARSRRLPAHAVRQRLLHVRGASAAARPLAARARRGRSSRPAGAPGVGVGGSWRPSRHRRSSMPARRNGVTA